MPKQGRYNTPGKNWGSKGTGSKASKRLKTKVSRMITGGPQKRKEV